MRSFILALVMMIAFPIIQARAQMDMIVDFKSYLDQTVTLYSQPVLDKDAIGTWTEKTTADEAEFKSTITSNISKKVITKTKNKSDLLSSIQSMGSDFFDSQASYTIKDSALGIDGKTGTVTYEFVLSGTKRQKNKEGGFKDMPIRSVSDCTENFVLRDNITQSIGSECTIKMFFEKPVPAP